MTDETKPDPPVLAPELLAALIHELRQPISAASLAAELDRPPLALIRSALRRTVRSLDALDWWAQSLAADPRAAAALKPRRIWKALQAVSLPIQDLQVEVPATLCCIAGPGILETVLENLLKNACTHGRGADTTLRAQVIEEPAARAFAPRMKGRAVLLTVADKGPGVAKDLKPRLFMPFARGGEREGIALGLWLCRQLCRAHGGEVWLNDTEVGTSISSLWPASPRPRGFAAMSQEQRAAVAKKGGQAAHARGVAHAFTSEQAREAGRKGGRRVSQDRAYMSRIGRRGGIAKGARSQRPHDGQDSTP